HVLTLLLMPCVADGSEAKLRDDSHSAGVGGDLSWPAYRGRGRVGSRRGAPMIAWMAVLFVSPLLAGFAFYLCRGPREDRVWPASRSPNGRYSPRSRGMRICADPSAGAI